MNVQHDQHIIDWREGGPDTLWAWKVVAGERMMLGVPNYDKPGVAERVSREVDEAEWAANPPRSTVDFLIMANADRMRRERRGY
jgi:hypothetical protein